MKNHGDIRPASQLVSTVFQGGETVGYLVIDTTVKGRSRGGLRLLPDVSAEEMRIVARSMTLKYGFLGLPQGGAKAGVLGDPEASAGERRRLLSRFGRAVGPLLKNRTYVPDTDMGTTNADIQSMLRSVGVRTKTREYRDTDSGYYTACTVMTAAERCGLHLGLPVSGAAVAIEGFGKVGAALAEKMQAAGARVVAVSTSRGAVFRETGLDVRRLRRLAEREGSRLVDHVPDAERTEGSRLLKFRVDLLCPCARHGSIHEGNAPFIRARIVCPGANNAVTPAAERILAERGVLCMPGFVANCGGVLGGTMSFASLDRGDIEHFIDRRIGGSISRILAEAGKRAVSPREVAEDMALRNFERVRRRAERPSAAGRVFQLLLEAYRRGWISGYPVAQLSLPYFASCLAR